MQYQAIIHINLYTAIDIQVAVHRDIFLYWGQLDALISQFILLLMMDRGTVQNM
jgi:hypothetical protein